MLHGVIVGMGRYRAGREVDQEQTARIKSVGSVTAEVIEPLRAMLQDARDDDSDFVWLGLTAPSPHEVELLGELLGISRLWIDDTLNPLQRAKAELAPDKRAGLAVFKMISYDDARSAIETGQIALLIGHSHVVTVRLGPIGSLTRVRAHLVDRPDLLAHGPLMAVHAILDAIVDDYLAASEELVRDVDALEEQVFSPEVTDSSAAIYRLKRENLELRRAVAPLVPIAQRMVTGSADGVPHDLRPFYHDVGDHLLRAHDNVDSTETLLISMLQASFAIQSLQQNTDMRKIGAYAAMLAVPTAIAGVYGMNFEHMPELSWTFGYPMVLTVMAASLFVLYRVFKRSGWL